MKSKGGFYSAYQVKKAIEGTLFDYLINKYGYWKINDNRNIDNHNGEVIRNDKIQFYYKIDKIEGYSIYIDEINNDNVYPANLIWFYRIKFPEILDYNEFIRNEYASHDFNSGNDYTNTKFKLKKIIQFIEKNYPKFFENGDLELFRENGFLLNGAKNE